MALSACGGDDTGTGAGGDSGGGGDLSLTMLPKNLGNPYFDTSTAGAKKAAEEIGASLEEVGPETASPDAQVQYINTAAQQAVDALIVSANDPTAICDAIDEARRTPTSRSSPSTPTPTPSAATSSSTRPPPRASPRSSSS